TMLAYTWSYIPCHCACKRKTLVFLLANCSKDLVAVARVTRCQARSNYSKLIECESFLIRSGRCWFPFRGQQSPLELIRSDRITPPVRWSRLKKISIKPDRSAERAPRFLHFLPMMGLSSAPAL